MYIKKYKICNLRRKFNINFNFRVAGLYNLKMLVINTSIKRGVFFETLRVAASLESIPEWNCTNCTVLCILYLQLLYDYEEFFIFYFLFIVLAATSFMTGLSSTITAVQLGDVCLLVLSFHNSIWHEMGCHINCLIDKTDLLYLRSFLYCRLGRLAG